MEKKNVIFCVLAICATFVVCSLILVKPNLLFRRAGGVNVKGYAVERVISDTVSWSFSISSSVSKVGTEKQVYSKVKSDLKIALDFLEKSGVSKKEIKVGSINVSDVKMRNENGSETNEIFGYTAFVTVSVTSADIALVEKVSSEIVALVENGVGIRAETPQFFYSKLESLKLSLIGKATQNAHERAMKLTESSGSKLGGIMSASQGVFQITQPLSTETSSWGVYETSTVEKDVKCIVNVEFGIAK